MENRGRPDGDEVREGVREYYGKELKGTSDLKTGACCCSSPMGDDVKAAYAEIDSEILERSYGCGSPLPPLLRGLTVLDLGCGTGKDVYAASKLVGPEGHVIGVDMTPEQLEVARRHVASQTQRYGYSEPNVEFLEGQIEDLRSLGIADGSVDVVISNCVINLSPDKEKVFSEAYRVLKEGGELYFSDIFADRRVPDSVYADPVVRGECLGGAMYYGDFRRLMRKVRFGPFWCVSASDVPVENEAIRKLTGDTVFTSRTVRAFKIEGLEEDEEDYGQMAAYMGDIPCYSDEFDLSSDIRFARGMWKRVSGNTAAALSGSRYRESFAVTGDRSRHLGRFSDGDGEDPNRCGPSGSSSGCCCCH
ncbi:MAG: methyltransferase domain-containing protein [Methanomethylophilus sp.]|jgi:arsenite methyltransferase